jgi:hypothetical protein
MKNPVFHRVIKHSGSWTDWAEGTNLRTQDGINWQAEEMGGDTGFDDAGDNAERPLMIAITENTVAPAASDTSILAEETADGLSRLTGTYSHTADQSSYTRTAAWQYTGGSVKTIAKAAMCTLSERTLATNSADTHFVITALSPVAVLDSNDTLEIQWGIFY